MNLFLGFLVGIAFTINFQHFFGFRSEVVQAIRQCEATLTRDKHCEYKITAEIIDNGVGESNEY